MCEHHEETRRWDAPMPLTAVWAKLPSLQPQHNCEDARVFADRVWMFNWANCDSNGGDRRLFVLSATSVLCQKNVHAQTGMRMPDGLNTHIRITPHATLNMLQFLRVAS
jgi:hypothetical protein